MKPRTKAMVASAIGALVATWWWWASAPSPKAPAVDGVVSEVEPVRAPSPPTPEPPALAPWAALPEPLVGPPVAPRTPPRTVSSKAFRIDQATFKTYRDRYTIPFGIRAPPDSPGGKQQYEQARWAARRSPSMMNLEQLRKATSVYRLYLVYHQGEPPETAAIVDHELAMSAMLLGAAISFDTLRERACSIAAVEPRCDASTPPGCLAAEQLLDMARGICADPEAEVPLFGGLEITYALGFR